MDLFDIPYDKDLKTLNLEKDDEGQEEHQYKITCDYYLKTKMDPNKYINVEFEKIVEEEFFVGAIYYGFDLPIAPELIRWEGKFKRLHQKDYKKKRTFNNNKSGKGLSKDEIEQDKKRREVIKQKKEIEAANKRKRDSAKLEKMAEIQQEFADNHYQYDINNPNYKKMQEQGDDNKDDD